MNKYIQEELAKGFIRHSTSPASAGFFFVKKKEGRLHLCINYRGLNEITVKFRYPLHLVPSALEQLRTAKFFTKLDLRNAYNLIRIRAGDEWKTAFSTNTGHYKYRVMPFSLVNSPSIFQSFINDVFRDMLNKCVIVYIDDILIYSESLQEHIQQVRAVLKHLIEHQLYAKAEECEFHLTPVSFLGYVISHKGDAMDESKVNAVLKWPLPFTIKELQHFLGFANFYRHFLRCFSSVAAPLTNMMRRGSSRLLWLSTAQEAFQELKQRFTTAPILHHPNPSSSFIAQVILVSTQPYNFFRTGFGGHVWERIPLIWFVSAKNIIPRNLPTYYQQDSSSLCQYHNVPGHILPWISLPTFPIPMAIPLYWPSLTVSLRHVASFPCLSYLPHWKQPNNYAI